MEIIYFVLVGLVGLAVGSFLNVVIYRVPNNISIIFPPSHCPKCKTPIKWYDNIPIISYCLLGGKCRHCKTHISFRYTFIEMLNTALWLIIFGLYYNTNLVLAFCFMVVSSILLIVSAIDLENTYIPDRFHVMLLLLGIIVILFDSSQSICNHLIGLGVGLVSMLIFYGFGYLLYKKEALGLGDVKLMAVCGLILGWQKILIALLIGAVIGAIILSILQAKNKDKNKEYPFAPYLAIGIIVALLGGDVILSLYGGIF